MTDSPDYTEYVARPLSPSLRSKIVDAGRKVRRQVVYDGVMLPYALMRHRQLLASSERTDSHTYTCFFRGPSQLQLLSGPILDLVGRGERLEILLLACSNGAEAYTIASWLITHAPDLDFRIRASDLHASMVSRAQEGQYSASEVLHSPYMTPDFLESTFVPSGDGYRVRPEVRARVEFSQASLLDGPELLRQFGTASIVIAQNVLFHLDKADAEVAFNGLVNLTAPGGVLMVEGMELDQRERLSAAHGLDPITHNQRRIYMETRIHTPPKWWNYYWGTEPYISLRQNSKRRYATAFQRLE